MRDGGPAFPIANAVFNADAPDSFEQFKAATSQSQGMSLRDYFAGQFLTGSRCPAVDETWEQFAGLAYRVADAMLAEREKP